MTPYSRTSTRTRMNGALSVAVAERLIFSLLNRTDCSIETTEEVGITVAPVQYRV